MAADAAEGTIREFKDTVIMMPTELEGGLETQELLERAEQAEKSQGTRNEHDLN